MKNELIDFVTRVTTLESKQEIGDVWLRACTNLGFETVNYTYASQGKAGDVTTSHLTTFNDPWMRHYTDSGMAQHDYMVQYIVDRNLLPFTHELESVSREHIDTPLKHDIWHGAAENGMRRALVVPFIDFEGTGYVGVSIGTSTMSTDDFRHQIDEYGDALLAMAHIAHQKLQGFTGSENSRDRFSPRQREIINLLVGGKTNKEICDILGISPPTVSFHLKAIREKLKVSTSREIVPTILLKTR